MATADATEEQKAAADLALEGVPENDVAALSAAITGWHNARTSYRVPIRVDFLGEALNLGGNMWELPGTRPNFHFYGNGVEVISSVMDYNGIGIRLSASHTVFDGFRITGGNQALVINNMSITVRNNIFRLAVSMLDKPLLFQTDASVHANIHYNEFDDNRNWEDSSLCPFVRLTGGNSVAYNLFSGINLLSVESWETQVHNNFFRGYEDILKISLRLPYGQDAEQQNDNCTGIFIGNIINAPTADLTVESTVRPYTANTLKDVNTIRVSGFYLTRV